MSPRLPITTLTELAQGRTDDAARALAGLRNANLGAAQKLELLLQYRADYAAQLQSLLAAGLDTTQWRNYHEFLGALDFAIEQQRAALSQSQAALDRGRGEWQHEQRRLSAFETLAERLRRQEAVAQGRREQRASDEQAARMLAAGAARA